MIKSSHEGDKRAMDDLFAIVYEDLKKLARKIRLDWKQEDTLNTTALVHEAYLKVYTNEELDHLDRLHFCRVCGRAMRYILQDSLKQKQSQKRGGNYQRVDEGQLQQLSYETAEGIEEILRNIRQLEQWDPLIGNVIECRFFSDMSVKETAELLQISPATVKRKWSFAKAYLSAELGQTA